jgi:GTP-binding protein LepA
MKIRMMGSGHEYEIYQVGIFNPGECMVEVLEAGMVGFFTASIKSLDEVRIGDTVTEVARPAKEALPGFKPVRQMVYCGLYPTSAEDYDSLKYALEKMRLNDSSISYEPDTSQALGFGFRCGFLGLLHSDVVQERLEREFDLDLVATAPSVVYRVKMNDGSYIEIDNPAKLPPPNRYEAIEEPYVRATIYSPKDYIGGIMELLDKKRGSYIDLQYLDKLRVVLRYDVPFGEMILDFYDKLKSISQGYASLEYEFTGYRPGKLVKMDIHIAGEPVDAFTMIVPNEQAYYRGQELVRKLKELIPRQMFVVPIQAMIGSRAISRVNVSALRKNVLAKCYGGDITRKRKLLEKQKKGKKRMKMVGSVEIPQEAFLAILKIEDKS